MRIFLLSIAAAAFAFMAAAEDQRIQAEASKPNILFILTDDQSYDTIAALGNREIRTPNLDRLADSGTAFINAYNMGAWGGAVCVASRTMLNSGRMLWRAGELGPRLTELTERREWWSQLMQDAGYETYLTGKWHVVVRNDGIPWNRKDPLQFIPLDPTPLFDYVVNERPGMPRGGPGGVPEGYHRPVRGEPDPWSPYAQTFGGYWDGDAHWSEVLAEDAIAFLEQAESSEAPFFMYLAFNAPHDPRQSPKPFVDLYPREDVDVPPSYAPEYPLKEAIGCGADLRDEMLAPFPRTEYAVRTHRQEYYAIISHMDEQVGRIIEALEASGKRDNTYIIFTSDHGLACGNHGFMGKQNMYEHSMRAPLIVVGPDIPAGETRSAPVYVQDVMATSLEIAGIERPNYVEFNSLLPLVRNPKRASAYDAIYGAYRTDLQRMIRKEDMKLIVYPKARRVRLFDLEHDPHELDDLAGDPSQWDIIARLFRHLAELDDSMGSQLDLYAAFPELAP